MENKNMKKITLYAYMLPEHYYSNEEHMATCEEHAPYGTTHCAWEVTLAIPGNVQYSSRWNDYLEIACARMSENDAWYMLYLDVRNKKVYGGNPIDPDRHPLDEIEVIEIERVC